MVNFSLTKEGQKQYNGQKTCFQQMMLKQVDIHIQILDIKINYNMDQNVKDKTIKLLGDKKKHRWPWVW